LCLMHCQGATPAEKTRLERIEGSPQFEDGRFRNAIVKPQIEGSAWGMMRNIAFGDQVRYPAKAFPTAVARAAFGEPPAELQVAWLGHSTLLLEIEGKRLLIDPIFENHVSPVPVYGKRFQPPPLPRDSLPRLDAVVISHDHYDHLEKASIVHFAKQGLPFYVPLGVGGHLERWGVDPSQIHELDWWGEASLQGLRLVCTPAQHFSGRGLFDARKTLWASWSFVGRERRAFYSGDGGYGPHFKAIGDALGPFDLTMIENGAYDKQWPHIHMFPEQGAQAHRDLRGKALMPVHWGMFSLANHDWYEPVRRLSAAAKANGVRLLTPRLGEAVRPLDSTATFEAWWERLAE
jgi:L-ascorbate metabolism protein UlaG (beta-lactamase superfamily)